jgi:hypothetical protein
MRVGQEITWILEGRTPDQIPMARLAEYMREFASLLGQTEHVNFARVEKGSTKLVAKVDAGAPVRRAQSRIYAVRDRRAPADAMRSYHRINEMLAEDDGRARVTFGTAAILRFPGKPTVAEKPVSMVDTATITGRLYALIEEQSGQLKARIRPRNAANYIACTASGSIGKELRKYFQEAVRVHGRGKWIRRETGEWQCESLHITEVHPVKDRTLREAIDALRTIEADWSDDPLAEWDALEENGDAA